MSVRVSVHDCRKVINLLVPLRGGLKGGAEKTGELLTTECGVKRGVGVGGAGARTPGNRGVGAAGRGGAMVPAPSTSCSNLRTREKERSPVNQTA